MKYVAPEYGKKAGGILIFKVPGIEKGCVSTGKQQRRDPLVFWTNASSSDAVVFTIPQGYEVYYLPDPVKVDTPYFTFNSSYRKTGNRVIYRGEYVRKAGRTSPQEYPRYQQYCQEMEKSCKKYVLF